MFNKIKRTLCVLLIVALMTVTVISPSAGAVSYPQGVTSEQAEQAIGKTDKLISGLMSRLSDKTLKDMIMPEICSSSVLSMLLVEVYKAIEENAETFSTLGINTSVSNVAYYLSGYPQVSSRLSGFSSWSQVDMNGVDWGVKDRQGFAVAASAMFTPLNSLLYALLCGGNYSINVLLGIKGDKGYENAILPIYEVLGCTSYVNPSTFYSQAAANTSTMVANIAYDLLGYVEEILDAPATVLTENLPSIAYFVNNGGLDQALSSLVEPLRISLLSVSIPINIDSFVDTSSLEGGLSFNIELGDMISFSDFQTAPLELETFASCGTVSGNRVIAAKGDVYIELLRWMIETLKLNQSSLMQMITTQSELPAEVISAITELMAKPADDIIVTLVNLLTGQSATENNYQWNFSKLTETTVTYTQNLNRDNFVKVVDGIDDLINEFVVESGGAATLKETLTPQIYSNSLLTKLVKEVFMLLQGEEMKEVISLLGIGVTPEDVAKTLTAEQFASVKAQLSNLASWEYISDGLNWGFEDGDKQGFINAVSAVLRPADGLFRMLFAGDKISFIDAIDFYGSDGYNTAVIPLMEAIGVYQENILTYNEYVEAIQTQDAITPILTSLCSLIDRVLERPVYTVTEILPNLMYFLNHGGLAICVENLIYPVMKILTDLGMEGMVDFSSLSQININALIGDMTANMEMTLILPELNLSVFEGMGTLEKTGSKRTQTGYTVEIYSVKADQPAVMFTLVKYLVEIIKMPGNEGLLDSFMGDTISDGSNPMFEMYSSNIGDEIAKMTVDETVEWLYQLFFKDRVVEDEPVDDGYTPSVTYDDPNKIPVKEILIGLFVVAVIAAVVIYTNRDRIRFFLEDRKDKKAKEESEEE